MNPSQETALAAFAVTTSNAPRSPRRCWLTGVRFATDIEAAREQAQKMCAEEGLTLRSVEPTEDPRG